MCRALTAYLCCDSLAAVLLLVAGTRSIQMLYRALLFTFAPTCIELVFVCALLGTVFSPVVAGLVGVTFATYVIWTLSLTQVGACCWAWLFLFVWAGSQSGLCGYWQVGRKQVGLLLFVWTGSRLGLLLFV